MLIDIDRYRTITGDTTSASAVVEAAVVEAQHLLEERLRRGLELDERTERVKLFPDGAVFPSATPLVAVPAGATVQGAAVLGAGPSGTFLRPDDHTTLTYTGGYDPDEDDVSAATYVPVELARAVAWAAKAIIDRAAATLEIPEGAISVRVGDVAVSWGPGGAPAGGEVIFPASLVRRYRWRTAA